MQAENIADLKKRINTLSQIKGNIRKLIDKYEKDVLMYVIDNTENIYINSLEVKKNLALMRKIEVKVLSKIIKDLENIIN